MGKPTHVGELFVRWLAEDPAATKDSEADAIAHLGFIRPRRGPDYTTVRVLHPNAVETLRHTRGFLMSDEALHRCLRHFHKGEENFPQLRQARDADAGEWKDFLRERALHHPDPITAMDAMTALLCYPRICCYRDLLDELYLERHLEQQGVPWQRFRFMLAHKSGYVPSAQICDWIGGKLGLEKHPELQQRFAQLFSGPDEQAPDKAQRHFDELVLRRFNAALSRAYEMGGIPVLHADVKTREIQQQPWPDKNQLDSVCRHFAGQSAAARTPWFDTAYYYPGDKNHPYNGRSLEEALRGLYDQASEARARLIAHPPAKKGRG